MGSILSGQLSPEHLTMQQPLCLTEEDPGFGAVLLRIKFF